MNVCECDLAKVHSVSGWYKQARAPITVWVCGRHFVVILLPLKGFRSAMSLIFNLASTLISRFKVYLLPLKGSPQPENKSKLLIARVSKLN